MFNDKNRRQVLVSVSLSCVDDDFVEIAILAKLEKLLSPFNILKSTKPELKKGSDVLSELEAEIKEIMLPQTMESPEQESPSVKM